MTIKAKSVYLIAASLVFLISVTSIFKILSSEPSKYEGKMVRKIEFEGLNNVAEEDIKEIMLTTEGYPLKAVEVRDDIKNIFALGQFENVNVEIDDFSDGVKLKLILVERPVVEKIKFKGNDEVIETTLLEVMKFKEGDVYRKDYLENSIKALKDKYEKDGYLNAYITYKVKDGDSKNSVFIDIIIDEGEDLKVKKLAILGATKYYVKDLLGLMDTKEDTIFQDGTYKREVFEEDKKKLIGFYQQEGYLDAQIVDEKDEYEWTNPIEKDKRCVYLVLKLSEGERYYFDGPYDVKIGDGKSNVLTDKEIENVKKTFLLQQQGEVFDNSKFLNDRQSISFLYASKGYIFARVVPNKTITEREVDVNGVKEKRKFVKVDFSVEEGSKAYIEQIIIKGNKKTKDKVIRREILVKEGELFDSEKMQVSRETIYNLGYFKQVNFDVRPGSRDGYMNLIVDVEEQPSGTISMGGGYGSSSGFSIFADIQENNFLGNGQTIGLKFEYGPKKSSMTLSFEERWLFDYPVGFNSSIFYYLYGYETTSIFTESDYTSEYRKMGYGYSLGLSYRFWYYWVTGVKWTQTYKRYIDPSGNSPDTIFVSVANGLQLKNTVTLYAYRDSRDNYQNPTKGFRTGLSAAFTGGSILKGDDHFNQYSPEFSLYFSPFNIPFVKNYPTVFEFRGSADFITPPMNKKWVSKHQSYENNEWLEYEDRLDIGGPETVRGWESDDSDMPDSWRYVGLYHRILYGAEYRFPVHPQMLWIVLFFDAGSLWSDKFWEEQLSDTDKAYVTDDLNSGTLRRIDQLKDGNLLPYFIYSYGFGFKVQIPMMPIRFWFAKKMIYDTKFRTISDFNFSFSMGDIRF